MKILIACLSLISMSFLLVTPALAVSVPTYPNCVNPQSSPNVENNGIHGIVGNPNTFTGNDKVYKLSANNTVEQCFCDNNGNGIQTNWLKTTGMSQDDVKILESQGWTFIPDGSAWGLDSDSYLAQNTTYACMGNSVSNGGSNNSNNSNSNSGDGLSDGKSDGKSSLIQQVLGAATDPGEVLGLAFTGNTQIIISLLLFGFLCLVAGYTVKKISK